MADPIQPLSSPFQFYRLTNKVDQWHPDYLVTRAIQKIVRLVTFLFDTALTPLYFGLGLLNLPGFAKASEAEINALKNKPQLVIPEYLSENELDKRITDAIARTLESSSKKRESSESNSLPEYLTEKALDLRISDAVANHSSPSPKEAGPSASALPLPNVDEAIKSALVPIQAALKELTEGDKDWKQRQELKDTLASFENKLSLCEESIEKIHQASKSKAEGAEKEVDSEKAKKLESFVSESLNQSMENYIQKVVDLTASKVAALEEESKKALEDRVANLENEKEKSKQELIEGLKLQLKEFHRSLQNLEETTNELYHAIGKPAPFSAGESEISEEARKKSILARFEELEKSLEAFQQLGTEKNNKLDLTIKALIELQTSFVLKKDMPPQDFFRETERRLKDFEECLRSVNTVIIGLQKKLHSKDDSFTESESDLSMPHQEKKESKQEIENTLSQLSPILPVNNDIVQDLLRGAEVDSFTLGAPEEPSDDQSQLANETKISLTQVKVEEKKKGR